MIYDSAASERVAAGIKLFHSVTDVEKVEVELANGSTVKSRRQGKVLVDTGILILVLRTVYFIPTLWLNLLSCSSLDEYGITTTIS